MKILNKLFLLNILSVLLILPFAVFAFDAGAVPNAAPGLSINGIVDIIFNVLWPISVAIIIIAFVVIGFMFFTAQGDATKISQARVAFIGAIIVTILVLLAFSIPFIIRNTLGQGI